MVLRSLSTTAATHHPFPSLVIEDVAAIASVDIIAEYFSALLDTLKMEDFTISQEDLTGLSGKVVVITGDF